MGHRGRVVELWLFTKLNGLAVLRRDNGGLSDKLMSVIYTDWESIASERGVSFLQFVLDMLYPTQSVVIPLLHSKAFASSYPRHVSEIQGQGRFLTSRVRIKIDAAFKPQFSQRYLTNLIINNSCCKLYMNRLGEIINIVYSYLFSVQYIYKYYS